MEDNCVQSGAHLGELRSWIRENALNSDTIRWGSQEIVKLIPQTAHDLDLLAQRIKDAISNDNDHTLERIKTLLCALENVKGVKDFKFNIMQCIASFLWTVYKIMGVR